MSAPSLQPLSVIIDLETPFDRAAVDAIVDAAFGPGRFAKTAERLREGAEPLADCTFVAREAGKVVGTVRLWPVVIGETRIAFLGPIAVQGGRRREGLGAQLVERACAAAEAAGLPGVLLVGDTPYFGRFGFVKADVRLPGPVDPRRVLLKMFGDRPLLSGDVRRG
ncbi:MAG: N-acetyltransferase [Proteobacteria bacterium]|nr:N-acetyltransferase [Pseudomonadota bacterium]